MLILILCIATIIVCTLNIGYEVGVNGNIFQIFASACLIALAVITLVAQH